MPKYKVKVYYYYVASVEVEAENEERAYEMGVDIAEDMTTEQLDYVGYADTEVIDETGFIHEFH